MAAFSSMAAEAPTQPAVAFVKFTDSPPGPGISAGPVGGAVRPP